MTSTLPQALQLRIADAVQGLARFDVPMSQLSYWRIGGLAAGVVEPRSVEALQAVRQLLHDEGIPSLVIGETSNLLFETGGYDGVLVRITDQLAGINIDGDDVVALAGTPVPVLARATADAGLAGLEHTVGIPGTIGGLVVMNGGSQRKYIGANVAKVVGVGSSGATSVLGADALHLGYRTSGLEALDLAVAEVHLRLPERDAPAAIHERMDAIVAERAVKFPLDLPSCGSAFLSDPAMYASVGPPGKAIEEAGLKGLTRGGAQISPRHANFIVNTGGASSDDVLWLIWTAQSTVKDRTGYTMACEARFVSRTGEVVAADVAAQRRWAPRAGR